MLKKLRIKFILFTMALVLVMLCVIFGTVYGFTAQSIERDSLDTMHSLAGRPNLPGEKRPKIQASYLVLQKSPTGEWVVQSSNAFEYGDDTYLNRLLQQAIAAEDRDGVLKEHSLRFLRMDIPVAQYIFMDISGEQAMLSNLVQVCCVIGVGSLILFFFISLLLANLSLRPVEAAWNEQKQFVADASHELKTPLAVIMTNAELLQEPAYPPEERVQFEKNILTMAYQMRHLVEGLLELTRLDNVVPDMIPLDLSALTEHALLPFEPVFFENAMQLTYKVTPGLWVQGSSLHLQQVVEIFLDNARKYADPGMVSASLQQAGSHALLVVENEGTPLTAQESKNIFLRFYRTDPARKRDGSYGLGLSIAQKIVQQHGGKIWAEGTAKGNRFCVLLPLDHRENNLQITEK